MSRMFIDPVLRSIRSSNEKIAEQQRLQEVMIAERNPSGAPPYPISKALKKLPSDQRRNYHIAEIVTGVLTALVLFPIGSAWATGLEPGLAAYLTVALLMLVVIMSLGNPVRKMFARSIPNHPMISGALHGATFIGMLAAVIYGVPLLASLLS